MRIVWTRQAQEDLEAIYQFWASRNEMYSARLYHSFVDSAEKLCGFPEMGAVERLLMHCPENFRSLLVGKNYKLIYTVEKADIVIHAIWDCRRNPDTLVHDTV